MPWSIYSKPWSKYSKRAFFGGTRHPRRTMRPEVKEKAIKAARGLDGLHEPFFP